MGCIGEYIGDYYRTIGVREGDTRSLDYGLSIVLLKGSVLSGSLLGIYPNSGIGGPALERFAR